MITKIMVEDKLFELGVDATLSGFDYIIEAIMLLDSGFHEWSKIYGEIAIRHNVSISIVKRRLDIILTWIRDHVSDYDLTERYIGFEECATTSSTLTRFYRRLIADQENEVSSNYTIDRNVLQQLIKETILGMLI